jgi:hypothetical protein
MATRGQQKRKKLNVELSKEELTKLEKEAERKSAERRRANKPKPKPKTTPPAGTRRARVQARRIAEKNIPKRVRDMMISPAQDAKNRKDAELRTEDRKKNTRGPQRPAPKGTLSNITKTSADGLKLAKKLARATGVLGLLSAEKLGDGSLYKGKSEAEVSAIIKRKAKEATKSPKTKNYNVGVSRGGVSFKEAFRHFRNKGAKTFTWNGKKYTTKLAK